MYILPQEAAYLQKTPVERKPNSLGLAKKKKKVLLEKPNHLLELL